MSDIELERKNQIYREEIENILEENNYLDNYLYAEYIINAFISDERNYQKNRFLRVARITNNIFKYCVETIKLLNPTLYQEYLISLSESEERRIKNNEKSLIRLAGVINKGYLEDGAKFDILDFYRFVPMRECAGNFVFELKKFMLKSDAIDDGVYNTIMGYIKDQEIKKIIFITENTTLSYYSFNRDARITPEVIHNVFRYMASFGLSKIEDVFQIILNRFLNEEITFDNLDKTEKRSKKRKVASYYNNPYKFVTNNKKN